MKTRRAFLPSLSLLCGLALPAVAQTPPSASAQPTADPAADQGLYVVVEATQRPLDAMLVLPANCSLPKPSCDMVESVLGNDTRLSGILRWMKGTPGLASAVVKTPMPQFSVRGAAATGAGATYVLASVVRPSRQAGMVELAVAVIDARDGKSLDLADYAVQVAPLASLRSMAHRVMNGVHGALTGVEGSFDSVIFYSAPAKAGEAAPGSLACNRCIWQVDADGANRRILVGDGGKDGIHMFPVQLMDGGLAYTSFRTGMPSLFKLDLAQMMAISELTAPLAKPQKGKKPGPPPPPAAPAEKPTIPKPFAAGPDLQFRGCAQNARGDIVATVNDGDQADLWSIDWTGTPSRNLTHHEQDDLGPTFSPDGNQIAFVSDRTGTPQVYVMGTDGSPPQRKTFVGPYNTDPEWGPDGRIAFSSMRGNAIDIMTVDAHGKLQRLTPGQGRRSLEPSWAPDGRRLVYASNEDGRGTRLWVTSHDGAAREPLDLPFGQYYTPSWQRMPGKGPKRWRGSTVSP